LDEDFKDVNILTYRAVLTEMDFSEFGK